MSDYHDHKYILQLEQEVATLRGLLDETMAERDRLTNGKPQYCLFCGQSYEAPEGGADDILPVLMAHIETCNLHPLAIEREAHAQTRKELVRLENICIAHARTEREYEARIDRAEAILRGAAGVAGAIGARARASYRGIQGAA